MIQVVSKYKHTPTESDIYIGRGSPLGNPYTSIQDRKTKAEHVCSSREESVANFRNYLLERIEMKDKTITTALNKIWKLAKNGDVYLVCFCKPKSCHGDVIKEIIEKKLT